jgi:hypothetical protein
MTGEQNQTVENLACGIMADNIYGTFLRLCLPSSWADRQCCQMTKKRLFARTL